MQLGQKWLPNRQKRLSSVVGAKDTRWHYREMKRTWPRGALSLVSSPQGLGIPSDWFGLPESMGGATMQRGIYEQQFH